MSSSVKSLELNPMPHNHHATSTPIRKSLSISGHPMHQPNHPKHQIIKQRASLHVERMLNEILINRKTKQSCDIIAKSVLFLKTRESQLHQNEYEITPSVQFNKITVFDELKQRAYACAMARDLIDFVAQERRHGYFYDEVFLQLRSEITYTSNNFINAYYNSHCTQSVDPVFLAIQCVHLACKTQSTFKRLEKLVLAARNCFKQQILFCKQRFAEIEMDILQSTGFQLLDIEDYPHKHIYNFKPIMAKKYDVFKASEKKMSTLCHCAILLATRLVEACPIMLNRNSPVLAAACLYVSNGFKDILNIKEWWKNVDGCECLSEKVLHEEADLVFDVVKHSSSDWIETIQHQVSPMEQLQLGNLSNNGLPLKGTVGHFEHKIQGVVGQSPPQSMMMSPMSSLASESSGFGSDNGKFSFNNSGSSGSRPKIEKQVLQPGHLSPLTSFMKNRSFTYEKSNSCSASTCSSETNSVKSELLTKSDYATKPPVRKTISTENNNPDSSSAAAAATATAPPTATITAPAPSTNNNNNNSFSKPEQIPFRKITTASPLTKSTSFTTTQHFNLSLHFPQQATATTAFTPHPHRKLPTDNSHHHHHFSLSPPTPTATTTKPVSSQDHINKLEKKYKNRLTALLCCEEITKYYASSKQRYAVLTRPEKDIVKDYKNKVKKARQQKLEVKAMTVCFSKKRRRHSELPCIGSGGGHVVQQAQPAGTSLLTITEPVVQPPEEKKPRLSQD